MSLKVGQTVDRYAVEAELGVGGMATVYRVRHTTLGSLHALKVLHVEGRGITERLLAEGRVQAGLDHPNALVVTDVIDVEGRPGLVMEFVDGGTLDQWVDAKNPSREARLAAFRGVCEAVASAHEKGWIHRDLKPANVLMKPIGQRSVPKVADFGLVKAVVGDQPHDGPRTRGGIPMGTPGYMAPEQIESAANVDARADVYSLGCILVWLLSGSEAFAADTMLDVFVKVAAGEHHSLPADDPLHGVVEKALALRPSDRYPDAGALLAALDDPHAVIPPSHTPSPRSTGTPKPPRTGKRPARRKLPVLPMVGIGVGAVLAIGAATGFVVLVLAANTVTTEVAEVAEVAVPATDCPLAQEGRIGWVRGSLPSFTTIPNPYELTERSEVYAEARQDAESVCTLPAGTKLEVKSRYRRPFSEVFYVAVEGATVTLP
ncbi:MAG: serine/threonine-protein kinase [Myxococcota bacterium]